jgi:uncharacterized protein (TIGR03435 family)
MRTMTLLLCAGLATIALAQTAEVLEFEAASIKPNKSGSGSSSSHSTSGQLVATNVTLRSCIRMAFGVRDYQISGPDWMDGERFDIVAKVPPHKGDNQLGPRMQKLLADRFGLVFHRETKEFPVYALLVAKNGSKLKAVEDTGNHNTDSSNGHMTAQQVSMGRLCEFLSSRMDRPVVDQTEMKGVYDLKLDYTPDDVADKQANKPGSDVASSPPLLTALQQQLGLKLQPSKAPIELIVIDRVEKVPTEN